MTMIKLRYVRRKRGNLFWEPTPKMRALGFLPKPLGPECPESHEEALALYRGWLEARKRARRVSAYPRGSLGFYYDHFRRSRAWARKGVRTREDYERAWKHLEPAFARKTITGISVESIEHFLDDDHSGGIENTLSPSERYRVMKVFRALLTDAIQRLQLTTPNPALAVPNPQPMGRSAIWLRSEVETLWTTAWDLGYHGMSLGIRVAWDTLFSPVDVRTTAKEQIKRDRQGFYIERLRTKTEREAFGALTPETAEALAAYIEGLGVELAPGSPVIRQRNGQAYRSKDTWGDDFRAVRAKAFPGDTRQFQDLRRSGNVEADAAGADKATMGEIMANNLASSRFLDATYTPPTVTKAREVHLQRIEGGKKLASEIDRLQSKSAR